MTITRGPSYPHDQASLYTSEAVTPGQESQASDWAQYGDYWAGQYQWYNQYQQQFSAMAQSPPSAASTASNTAHSLQMYPWMSLTRSQAPQVESPTHSGSGDSSPSSSPSPIPDDCITILSQSASCS